MNLFCFPSSCCFSRQNDNSLHRFRSRRQYYMPFPLSVLKAALRYVVLAVLIFRAAHYYVVFIVSTQGGTSLCRFDCLTGCFHVVFSSNFSFLALFFIVELHNCISLQCSCYLVSSSCYLFIMYDLF